jgi:O-antigen ligase
MVWAVSAVLGVMGIWALFNPFVGLIGVLAIIFVRPGELYPILDAIHIQRTFTLLVLISFLVHERRLQVPKVSKALLIFWIAMFCTVPLAFWRAGAFSNSFDFGKVIMYHLLIVNLATTAKRFRIVLITICGLVAWMAAWSSYLYYAGEFQVRMGIQRAVGLNSQTSDPNALGITLVTALPLLLLLWSKDAGRIRWLMIPLTAICLWTIVLTGSRTSYIVFVALAMVYALTHRYRVPMAIGTVVLLAAIWFTLPSQYRERIATVDNLSADDSYQGRVQSWSAAWEMFKHNPLTGVGVGEFSDAHGAMSKHWLNVHSLYFQLLSEMGLVGIFSFGAFLISVFRENRLIYRRAKRIPNCPVWFRQYPAACNLAFIGLLLTGYSSHNLGRDTWYFFAGLTAAAGLVAKRELHVAEQRKDSEVAVQVASPVGLAEVQA